TLSADAPKHYVLNEGADVGNGARQYARLCAGCHGETGDAMAIDGTLTLGSFGRMNAYEGWLKVVNGHPGSPMGRQSTDAKVILDLFAALCDRSAFPAKPGAEDVADGDARCGAYLK